MDIDAVIMWVDGQDPAFIAKKSAFVKDKKILGIENVAGWQRYENNGEIFWCVASLNKFAPWLRKIWIVTDGQDPHLERFLNANFPDGYIPYEIVDHSVIFRGYEEYLPTFSSTAIETMTWRIPGLSEHYIELNDDFVLASPVSPQDFFQDDGSPICYGRKQRIWFTKLTRKLKKPGDVTYKGKLVNSADMLGQRGWYIRIQHTPKPLLRSFFEKYYRLHPGAIDRNIMTRFRSASNFNVHELFYLYEMRMGKCELRPFKGNLLYLKPTERRGLGYMAHKLSRLMRRKYKFACLNSLDRESARMVSGYLKDNKILLAESKS